MKIRIKKWIEKLSGCRIYRDTLPHGTDLFKDLTSVLSPTSFRCVLDVGSHHGQSIGSYLEAFPQAVIHGLEPNEESFSRLEKLVGSNQRVQLHRIAGSDVNGEATLYLKAADTTHSLIQADDSVGSQQVRTTTLDSFCSEHGLDRVDFCKIDTEGNDLSVLKGASELLRKRRISFVQVETSTRQDVNFFCQFQDIERYLNEAGYELFGLYDQQPCWSGRKSLLYFNAVFISGNLVGDVPPILSEHSR